MFARNEILFLLPLSNSFKFSRICIFFVWHSFNFSFVNIKSGPKERMLKKQRSNKIGPKTLSEVNFLQIYLVGWNKLILVLFTGLYFSMSFGGGFKSLKFEDDSFAWYWGVRPDSLICVFYINHYEIIRLSKTRYFLR